MLTRRRLFQLLTGAAVTAALKPLAALVPAESVTVDILKHVPKTISYSTYLVGSDALTVSSIRKCVASLQGANARPHKDAYYSFYVHPDFVNLKTGELL